MTKAEYIIFKCETIEQIKEEHPEWNTEQVTKYFSAVKAVLEQKGFFKKETYKTKDLFNADKWYSSTITEMKKQAKEYVDECEGDCILEYRIYNPETEKYRLMTEQEIINAKLPR